MANFREWMGRLRGSIQEVQPDELQEWQEDEEDFVLIDVRESDEIRQGVVNGAVPLPRAHLVQAAEKLIPNKDTKIVAYCAGGVRSLFAAESLQKLGYTDVWSMAGGFGRWSDIGGDIVKPTEGFKAPSGDTPDADAMIAELSPDLVSPADANAEVEAGKAVLVDVREADELDRGRIPDSVHVPRGFLELKIEATIPDKSSALILTCGGGRRGPLAASALHEMGYTNVRVLDGGYGAWKEAGLKVEVPFVLSDEDRARYARHLNIPEVGPEGQAKLLQAKVLLIGAGGLGCPTALYSAAAGVGTLGILDFDVVDESNLQRQVLHNTETVGMPKVESAKQALQKLNPGVNIVTHNTRIDSTNVEEIFSQYDIVVDGTDNFPTRYLINDCCVKLGLPNVHGSVYRFEGQVTVFAPSLGGPCYRCLYPEPPPPELAPSCAEAGVLGVLPGIIGCLQAMETIKVILGAGDALVGQLLCYDGLRNNFEIRQLFKDPDCAYCGEGKEFPGYIDYEFFCANPG
jgi:molybdopterin/thiamine biosynthesis adenylyltransferase/rhodanese-related sulfurtransferase